MDINSSIDGVKIIILLLGDAKPYPITTKMEQINQNSDNDVNGSGSCGEASSSGIGIDATQVYLGRYSTTAEEGVGPQRGRKRWTRLENREVMECYIDSEPEKRG